MPKFQTGGQGQAHENICENGLYKNYSRHKRIRHGSRGIYCICTARKSGVSRVLSGCNFLWFSMSGLRDYQSSSVLDNWKMAAGVATESGCLFACGYSSVFCYLPLSAGKKGSGAQVADSSGIRTISRHLYCAHVFVFSGQGTLRLYGRQHSGAHTAFLQTNTATGRNLMIPICRRRRREEPDRLR